MSPKKSGVYLPLLFTSTALLMRMRWSGPKEPAPPTLCHRERPCSSCAKGTSAGQNRSACSEPRDV